MLLLFLIFGPIILVSIDFIKFILTGKRFFGFAGCFIFDIIVLIGLPWFFFETDADTNNCCGDSATFSPEHLTTILVLIIFSILAYFISSWREHKYSPVVGVFVNVFLLIGIVFNVIMAIHLEDDIFFFGNVPIGLLFIMELIRNHKHYIELNVSKTHEYKSVIERLAWKILTAKIFWKIPVLLILILPVMTIIISFLLLFGQKPDSIIRAFTDTYKHGFSQWDYMCENVDCGEHYLCSVAANGHKKVVKPVRYGERNGGTIICNRQLLISNAFEELLEEKAPRIHWIIRRNYNRVGKLVHKYYGVFNNKFVADTVFILMKPAEIFFLFILYTFDQKPENRIARQYLPKSPKLYV